MQGVLPTAVPLRNGGRLLQRPPFAFALVPHPPRPPTTRQGHSPRAIAQCLPDRHGFSRMDALHETLPDKTSVMPAREHPTRPPREWTVNRVLGIGRLVRRRRRLRRGGADNRKLCPTRSWQTYSTAPQANGHCHNHAGWRQLDLHGGAPEKRLGILTHCHREITWEKALDTGRQSATSPVLSPAHHRRSWRARLHGEALAAAHLERAAARRRHCLTRRAPLLSVQRAPCGAPHGRPAVPATRRVSRRVPAAVVSARSARRPVRSQ